MNSGPRLETIDTSSLYLNTSLVKNSSTRSSADMLLLYGIYSTYFVNRSTIIRIELNVLPPYFDGGSLTTKLSVICSYGLVRRGKDCSYLYGLYLAIRDR